MLVRDAAVLDAESLALLLAIGQEHGVQLWVERVGAGEECSVIIEDGAVVSGGAK